MNLKPRSRESVDTWFAGLCAKSPHEMKRLKRARKIVLIGMQFCDTIP
jgi:hypothetical protein